MSTAAPWWMAVAIAFAIGLGAWRAKSLSGSGALLAFSIGTLALRTAWSWGAFLIVWFVLASLLSRFGRAVKQQRTQEIVAKSDQRDAWQVLANGGVFAVCALLSLFVPAHAHAFTAAAAGALTAAGADTWSTEIGTFLGGTPWSLRSNSRVPVGTSGAITLRGSIAGIAGALVLASVALGLAMITRESWFAVALGGIGGVVADTLLGAWVQERRFCPPCQRATERNVHSCGTKTERIGGIAHLDNDAVNLAATIVGAAISAVVVIAG